METMREAIRALKSQCAYDREQDKWEFLEMILVEKQREFQLSKLGDGCDRSYVRMVRNALRDLRDEGYITLCEKRPKGITYAIVEFTESGKRRADAWWKKKCDDYAEALIAELESEQYP